MKKTLLKRLFGIESSSENKQPPRPKSEPIHLTTPSRIANKLKDNQNIKAKADNDERHAATSSKPFHASTAMKALAFLDPILMLIALASIVGNLLFAKAKPKPEPDMILYPNRAIKFNIYHSKMGAHYLDIERGEKRAKNLKEARENLNKYNVRYRNQQNEEFFPDLTVPPGPQLAPQ
ncbi:MAG: hypothetical protein GY821_11910 [Gammaproteobacteria bacterium]|nr:hypothetical protein [Gammaproteobacteria bacterium]